MWSAAGRVGVAGGLEFEIAYVDAESGARRLALIDAWSVPFEECMPVRGFPS